MDDRLAPGESADTGWPLDGVEPTDGCPVCGSAEKEPLHTDLSDLVAESPPFSWVMDRCLTCGSAHLDPRPTRAAIHLAYRDYYTHDATSSPEESIRAESRARRTLRSAVNGYRNARYGTTFEPSSTALGAAIVGIRPLARYIDASARHLGPASDCGGRLLDIGCGNGKFMQFAENAGWRCTGIDFDAAAVDYCRELGLDVETGGVETLADMTAEFDVVTAAHVIEHLHTPTELVTEGDRLLRPGGMLWLETPNVDAEGHRRFGPTWRGLEAPRHLTVLSWTGLRSLLLEAGFANIDLRRRALSALFTYAESQAPESRRFVLGPSGPTLSPKFWWDWIRQAADPRRQEFLCVTARKPA